MVLDEILEERVVSSRGQQKPRGVKRKMSRTTSILPGSATGLIVQLNRDSARHFEGRPGTANVSVPVSTVGTLRFGFYVGTHRRPRCEFPLRMRYVVDSGAVCEQSTSTNVMVYGYAEEETGHGDVRMLLPRAPVRAIREFASDSGSRIPAEEDPMVLEWPTLSDPSFKATFADANSNLFTILKELLESAIQRGQSVGRGACWLVPGMVSLPNWH